MNYKLEICANSVASCLEAQKGGAYRVELCASIPEGGTTPSYATIALARELLNIKLHVIIRPRGGDFLYSPLEHKIMLNDIETAKKLHADGVVIGCLTAQGDIDMQRNRELIDAAEGMSVTFHRAFDMSRDPFESLENIISLGCDRLLTSGQQPKAEQGIPLLKQLVQQAGERIIVMPGSGINEYNIAKIARETQAKEFHLSVREKVESKMIYRKPTLAMGSTTSAIDEYAQEITSALRVEKALKSLLQEG
jgi:copper homeostasis protein